MSPQSPQTWPTVSVSQLADRLTHSSLVLLDATALLPSPRHDGDFRATSGLESWRDAHIPGSRHADLVDALSDHAKPYHFAVPEPLDLAERLGVLGVRDGADIVLYDNSGGIWAARLWWMLRGIGVQAAVLDGGLAAWLADGRETVSGDDAPPVQAGVLTVTPHPEVWATIADVESLSAGERDAGDTASLVCALGADMYSGEATTRYSRRGHIPGSVNVPARSLTGSDGLLLPEPDLRTALSPLIDTPGPVVAYCGGGISAALLGLALVAVGRADVSVYDGSLEEWTKDPDRPLVLGP